MLENFFRKEQKYYLSEKEYQSLIKMIQNNIVKDQYYDEKICSIYFDNKNNDLIINSLNKPIYKEKVRLRCYNTPTDDSIVFLEIKKKYKGMVYKRRINLTYKEAKDYINKGLIPENNSQIFKEIDYCFQKYNLIPKVNITYDRYAYYAKDDPSLRITFDHNIQSSTTNLTLDNKVYENNVIKDNYIMEIKSINGMPFWLLKSLCELKLFPSSFSKYGEVYQNLKEGENYV